MGGDFTVEEMPDLAVQIRCGDLCGSPLRIIHRLSGRS
jgi:hypothetical protein